MYITVIPVRVEWYSNYFFSTNFRKMFKYQI